MGGGCGGGGSSTNTTYTQAIPPELMPYATRTLGTAEDLVFKQPSMQEYTGQRTAGINPLQAQGYTGVSQLGPSQYTGQGANLAGYAATRDFSGANVNQYMNPYLSTMQQGAIRDYARNIPGMGAAAARVGGLGGSRSAILEAEGQRNLQNQLQDIQAKGYESARNQFNTANANMLAGAGQLGQFGQQDYTQRLGAAQAQLGAGAQQQAIEQQRLNTSYQQFIDQQMKPYQQLNYMMGLVRGTPVQNMGQTMYQPAPGMAQQILGLGMGAAGLSQAFGKAEGGEIKGYKGGGIVSLARGGSTPVEKMGAIDASTKQFSKIMPPQAANAKVQQTLTGLPDSVDWQNAAALLAYNKAHPAVAEPPKQDSVVVQMAKQIAMQSDAEKMAEAQKAQQAQQAQMAMQQMQQAQQPQTPQQGVAGIPAPNVGQNYTPTGITAPAQEDQGAPQVNAAEGGGIADLHSNVGEHYASGGIVAFDEGGDVVHAANGLAVSSGGGGYTPNWQFWRGAGDSGIDPKLAEEMFPGKGRLEQFGEKAAELYKSSGGAKGALKLVPGVVRRGLPYAGVASELAFPEESKAAYASDPDVPVVERVKQRALDIAPEVAGAGTAVGAGALTGLATANPFVGAGAGLAGYQAGKSATKAVLPATTAAFDDWYKNKWLPTHPEGGTQKQVQAAAAKDKVDTSTVDISKYLQASAPTKVSSGAGAGLGALNIPMQAPTLEMPKVQSVEDLTKEIQDIKDKAGVGKAQAAYVDFLKGQEAKVGEDSKFNKSMSLAQWGFKLMSTPGFGKAFGEGGAEYAQNMMALKKEENTARNAYQQAILQANVAIEKGKEDAINTAIGKQEKQRDRLLQATHDQATLTEQHFGNLVQLAGVRSTAAHQAALENLQAQQLDLDRQKAALQIGFNKAVAAGDKPAQDAFLEKIKAVNEASTGYLSKLAGIDAGALTNLTRNPMYQQNLNAYTTAKTTDEKLKALGMLQSLARSQGISDDQLSYILSGGGGVSQGPI